MTFDIRVVNRHHKTKPAKGVTRVYCARPSVLGNPFVIGKDGDRAAVIEAFRKHLWEKLTQGHAPTISALDALTQSAQRGPVELECFCAPAPCHCDVIREAVLHRAAQH